MAALTIAPLLPFLPPPVVSLIKLVDNAVPVPEFSLHLILTLLALLLLSRLPSLLLSRPSPSSYAPGSAAVPAASRTTVLLLGPPSSGKTLLLHSLLSPSPAPPTLTTMSPTTRTLPFGNGALITDHPGHPRLSSSVPRHLAACRLLIFTLPSNAPSALPAAARILYDALASPPFRGVTAALVLCTFANAPLAKTPARLRTALNVELERLRKTDLTLQETGDGAPEREAVRIGGRAMDVERDAGVEVTFVAGDLKGDGKGKVEAWIRGKLAE